MAGPRWHRAQLRGWPAPGCDQSSGPMGGNPTRPKSRVVAQGDGYPREAQRSGSGEHSGGGVVRFCVHGIDPTSGTYRFPPAELIARVQAGLPFRELEELRSCLGVPTEKLAPMLGISKATFHRRKGDGGRLPPAVSDRVVRYARLLGEAFRAFDSLDAARRWLRAPQVGLGGAVPLSYASTEIGAREVENLLGRIEYGAFS